MPDATFINISRFWPTDEKNFPVTVNSVYETFFPTPNKIAYRTLRGAYDGTLRRGEYATLKKLARICSQWQNRPVMVDEILEDREFVPKLEPENPKPKSNRGRKPKKK